MSFSFVEADDLLKLSVHVKRMFITSIIADLEVRVQHVLEGAKAGSSFTHSVYLVPILSGHNLTTYHKLSHCPIQLDKRSSDYYSY